MKDKKIRALYAFISLLAWIRVLYYFRIFKATGFYIRMLLQICIDILAFLFILALTIFSFAHVFLIMLKENTQEGAELVNIWGSIRKSYLIVFGQYDMIDGFGDFNFNLSWFFFICITIFINIILLNLLISIISDTYSRFKENYNVI